MRLVLASDRSRPRNGNRIWLVSCVVTLVVAVFVVLQVTGSSCPADPRAGGATAPAGGAAAPAAGATAPAARPAALARPVIEGQAVFYDPGQATGSCGLGPFPAGGRYASLPPRSYASGRACGSYLDVHGPRGTVRAEVVDLCTDCPAGTVNLSRAAFARIADPGTGMVAVSYRTAVDPPLPGPLVLRISTAARNGALAVQVLNHGNRLSSVTASWPGGRWQRLAPGPGGYWTGPLRPGRPRPGRPRPGAPPGRAGDARIRVRVTDVAGHQVVLTGIPDDSTVLHATTWMYRGGRLAGSTAPTPSPAPTAQPSRRPRPAAPPGSC
jgi:expansin